MIGFPEKLPDSNDELQKLIQVSETLSLQREIAAKEAFIEDDWAKFSLLMLSPFDPNVVKIATLAAAFENGIT